MRSGGGGGSDGWALGLDRQSYLNRAAAAAKVAACTGVHHATTIHTIGNNHLLQISTYRSHRSEGSQRYTKHARHARHARHTETGATRPSPARPLEYPPSHSSLNLPGELRESSLDAV